MAGRSVTLVLIAGLLLSGGLVPAAAAPEAASLSGSEPLGEIEAELKALASRGGRGVSLRSIGASAGGRPLWVLRVAATGGPGVDERPGILVAANAEGHRLLGTEAVLHLARRLAQDGDEQISELLAGTTFYLLPALNPDALASLARGPRRRVSGNAARLDRDLDGLEAEDGPEDLDGDGRITRMRIPDADGGWLPHPEDSRVMVREDPSRRWVGTHRLVSEGDDDDGDGAFNEDPAEGHEPSIAFPMAFPHRRPEAGPWPGYAPEAKALMDFVVGRRNLAAAVVYGAANTLLETPRPLGVGGPGPGGRFEPSERTARFLGLEPGRAYTVDEAWEQVKDNPFVRRNRIGKDRIAQILGAGPADRITDDDAEHLEEITESYEKRLEEAALDPKRPASSWRGGGPAPWLYFHAGLLALELDLWGVPKEVEDTEDEEPAEAGELASPTLEEVQAMTGEELAALGEEGISRFLESVEAPERVTAEGLLERLEEGMEPERLVAMLRRSGAEGEDDGGDDEAAARARTVLAWVDRHAPDRHTPWSSRTLADGTVVEVGGVDPLLEAHPPSTVADPALEVHTETVLDLARRLGRVAIADATAKALGDGVWEVRAVAANTGGLPTHTAMAERARTHLPVRLALELPPGADLVTGRNAATAERLEPGAGSMAATWMVRAPDGSRVRLRVSSEQAGEDERTLVLDASEGGRR